jgi:spectinomycin phosphotransferase
VLEAVRESWHPRIDRVVHQPVGFGAHHWAAYAGADPTLFVTYDLPKRAAPVLEAAELEAAYSGAVSLREGGLELVLAPLPLRSGRATLPFADGSLSCTPWYDGTSGGLLDVPWTVDALRRLHDVTPPPGVPRWRPKVGPDFADSLARLVTEAWGPGPYAVRARDGVRRHLGDISRWTSRYHRLAQAAESRPWVAAHGEPHADNQLQTAEGRFLVDWDTLRLAPRELDLRTVVEAGVPPAELGADAEMLELFDLEWRLDEISQYAAWFSAPHLGTADDDIAMDGLDEELARPSLSRRIHRAEPAR